MTKSTIWKSFNLSPSNTELAKALTPQVSANSYGVYVTTHKQEP